MNRVALPTDDRLLTARRAAKRLICSRGDFFVIARDCPYLKAGKRYRGRRAYWLKSAVIRHMHFGMATRPSLASTEPATVAP